MLAGPRSPVDQQPVSGRQPALGKVGQRAHARHLGVCGRVNGLAHRANGRVMRPVEVADLRRALGRQGQPFGPRRGIRGELHRPLVGGRGRRVSAARHGIGGGLLQLGRHLLIRLRRRCGQVPGPAVRVGRPPQRVSKRPVHGQPPAQPSAVVCRCADQWMAEGDRTASDMDQPGLLGRRQVRDLHPERPARG